MDNALNAALEDLRKLFPNKSTSWIRRCMLRLKDVKPVFASRNVEQWIVRGNAKLGDRFKIYIVTLYPRERKSFCSCYAPQRKFNIKRMKMTCTHVGAVYLYKLVQKWRCKE